MMRSTVSLFAATVFCAGLAVLATPASALNTVPAKPAVASASPVVDLAGWRCGPGRHVNRRGRCVRNRRW